MLSWHDFPWLTNMYPFNRYKGLVWICSETFSYIYKLWHFQILSSVSPEYQLFSISLSQDPSSIFTAKHTAISILPFQLLQNLLLTEMFLLSIYSEQWCDIQNFSPLSTILWPHSWALFIWYFLLTKSCWLLCMIFEGEITVKFKALVYIILTHFLTAQNTIRATAGLWEEK